MSFTKEVLTKEEREKLQEHISKELKIKCQVKHDGRVIIIVPRDTSKSNIQKIAAHVKREFQATLNAF